ncbi:plasma-membrane choline transporter-domain-containing protein [Polychytrium aggregatum]|uniref:plasma-membrane choline transporter-domain-containing protein n=1 Tax=Polychytrium aggregatum TaxID=110093 RepID=UPI0022FEFF3C|nr:plasma-membrane choline transporter-domain-containing protein [Polychytrium aggregatum]KAI9202826.1 plasma-membrane choline transporter-domain-containing protein [Polychytrium aggregatum]
MSFHKLKDESPFGYVGQGGPGIAGGGGGLPDGTAAASRVPVINTSPKYQDVWAAVVYAVTFAGFVVMAAVSIPSNVRHASFNTTSDPSPPIDLAAIAIAFVVLLAISIVFTIFWLWLVNRYTIQMIKAAFWFPVAMMALMALALFLSHQPGLGGLAITLVVLDGIMVIWVFFALRGNKIPVTAAILKSSTRIVKQFPSVVAVSIVGTAVALAFGVVWVLTMAGFVTMIEDNAALSASARNTYFSLLVLLLVFIYYWTSQVINNVVHVTCAGLFATVYFMGVAAPGVSNIVLAVPNPTWKAAKRAMTTSFGSICFGSLLIALMQLLRYMINNAKDAVSRSDAGVGAWFILCCLDCILKVMEDLMNYFNRYAFTEIAIYGKSYLEAGKSTWQLFKQRGLEVLINDCLVDMTMSMGGFFMALLGGAAGYIIGKVSPSLANTPAAVGLCVALGVVTCIYSYNSVTMVLSSGSSATLVCIAEDPQTLEAMQPELFATLKQVWPDMDWRVDPTPPPMSMPGTVVMYV